MYSTFIPCQVPIRSAQVVGQQMQHVDSVIQHGHKSFLQRRKWYSEVRAVPPPPLHRKDTLACSSASHAPLQTATSKKSTRLTTPQETALGKTQTRNLETTTYNREINRNLKTGRHPIISVHLPGIPQLYHSHPLINI